MMQHNLDPAVARGHNSLAMACLLGLGLILASAVQADAAACADASVTNPHMAATTPTSDFVLHDDGTATHVPTGLMWQRCSQGRVWDGQAGRCTPGIDLELTWFAAHRYVEEVNANGGPAGHDDWRLPNLNEFESIAELACWNPGINTEVFPDIYFGGNERYWSSSPFSQAPSGTSSAWTAQFSDGGLIDISLWSTNRILLVRDADPVAPDD